MAQVTFGRKQSGLPDFKVADLVHDYRILETARKDATDMLETDAFGRMMSTNIYVKCLKIQVFYKGIASIN